nr:hypothetical protein [Tanacetum cinerariifolium]
MYCRTRCLIGVVPLVNSRSRKCWCDSDDDNPERHRHATRRVAAIKLFRTRELIIETVGSSDSENEKIEHE